MEDNWNTIQILKSCYNYIKSKLLYYIWVEIIILIFTYVNTPLFLLLIQLDVFNGGNLNFSYDSKFINHKLMLPH